MLNRFKNHRGSALILSVSVAAFLIVIFTGLIALASNQVLNSRNMINSNRAFYLAESGADLALSFLLSLGAPPGGIEAIHPFGAGDLTTFGGTHSIEIIPDPNNPTEEIKRYTVNSRGSVGAQTRVIQTELRMESFAKYAYFTNGEYNETIGANVWFTSIHNIQGPLHTNGQFNIYGDPVFDGFLTSESSSFNYFNGGPPNDNPVFNAGFELDVPEITIPHHPQNFIDRLSAGGLNISGDSVITLNSDGTVTYTENHAGTPVSTTVNVASTNGVIYVDGNAAVQGTLNGQLTILSEQDMYIIDNVVYSDDPRTNQGSTDLLGLVSNKNVLVWTHAPHNLEINAVIMAKQNSFAVENYASGLKGTLTVHGGIIQNFRGPVGTFNSGTGQRVSGYAPNYSYDPRMAELPSPGFPLTGLLERTGWSEIYE